MAPSKVSGTSSRFRMESRLVGFDGPFCAMFSATNATVEAGRARRSRDMLGGDALHEVLVMVMRIDATIVTLPRRSRLESISFFHAISRFSANEVEYIVQ